ncbi:hypothetical protein Aperf_G00000012733 [Anoplocephala perfoliata]
MNGKLYIAKYHMVHNHSQLPENIVIDQRIRRLQVQQAGKDDFIISDDVQGVLDDIVDHPSKFDTPVEGSDLQLRSPRTATERKAAAKDRLAARTKKARGVKIAPYLRRLAEIATTDTVPDFHKHLGELETLVEIWKQGGVSPLASTSTTAVVRSDSGFVTPSQRDTIVIAKAVEDIIRKQKTLDNPSSSTSASSKSSGRSPKAAQIITPLGGSTISIVQPSSQPVVLKQALGAQSGPFDNATGVVTLSSSSVATLPKDVMIADAGNGQFQLIATSGAKNDNGQPIVGYVLQPMGGPAILSTGAVPNSTNFVPIAPKLPVVGDSPTQTFQAIPPPPPKSIRPQMPVCKPKVLKPRGRQPKIRQGFISMTSSGPIASRYEDNSGVPKPWTPMIMEGDSCSYFLFVEDVNYFYSPEEDAWLPLEQRTMAVDV